MGCTSSAPTRGRRASTSARPTSSRRSRPTSRSGTRGTAPSMCRIGSSASWVYELPFGRGRRVRLGHAGGARRGARWLAGERHRNLRAGAVPDARPRDRLADHRYRSRSPARTSSANIEEGRQLPDRYLNPAAFDFPRDAQGNRIRVQGNAGRNTIQQPGINNWDIGLVQELPSRRSVQRTVPMGDVQHAEPHAIRRREPEHEQPDVRRHHQHARGPASHAVRASIDVLRANGN